MSNAELLVQTEITHLNTIYYVVSSVPVKILENIAKKLLKELPIKEVKAYKKIDDLFSAVAKSHNIDFIVLDVDDLFGFKDFNVFDLIKTLSTLLKINSSGPENKKTNIVALIGSNTKYTIVKELLSLNEIDYIGLKSAPDISYEMIRDSVKNYLNNGQKVPKVVADLIKKSKCAKSIKNTRNQLYLTIRQKQIFDIVTTRGVSNKHIANMLNIKESTVKLHMGSILKKYGVKNRTQLAVFAKQQPITQR